MLETAVRGQTLLTTTVLVPEIRLHLARDPTGIFAAIDDLERPGDRYPPYWAFAWPGGQAMARLLLDRPEMVAGKRVLDIGSGSGIAAIAAALGSAAEVLAVDIDPLATMAVGLNAAANGVALATLTGDVLGDLPATDVVLIGDLVYEPELQTRVAATLEEARRQGLDVLIADRTSARRPPMALEAVAEYDASLTPPLPAHAFERARIWRLSGARRAKRG